MATTTNRVRTFKAILRLCMTLVLVVALLFRRDVNPRKLALRDDNAIVQNTQSLFPSETPNDLHVTDDRSTKKDGRASQRVAVSVPYVDRTQRTKRLQTQNKERPVARVAQTRPQRSRTKKKTRKEKTNIKNFQDQEALGLPPLESLIGDLHQNVTGDVQFLLDFAIVGFGKCGTTALIDWLDGHPEINTIEKEALHLSRHRPALMVEKLYEMKIESLRKEQAQHDGQQQKISSHDSSVTSALAKSTTREGRIQGFKNPSDVRRPESMAYLRQYWPQTKLIITVRHPVHWFRSLYNFLVNEMGRSKKYLRSNPLIGGPHKNTAYAHTGKGEFHAILSLLGKTDMVGEEELELLKGFLREDEIMDWPQRLPNQIFFLETSQMADKNETRSALFRKDLQQFLGLEQELPPVLHVRPRGDRQVDENLKIDMCDPENEAMRRELMRISEKASLWIRKFFLNSPDVVVSSRDYLEEIFATSWLQDPCTTTTS